MQYTITPLGSSNITHRNSGSSRRLNFGRAYQAERKKDYLSIFNQLQNSYKMTAFWLPNAQRQSKSNLYFLLVTQIYIAVKIRNLQYAAPCNSTYNIFPVQLQTPRCFINFFRTTNTYPFEQKLSSKPYFVPYWQFLNRTQHWEVIIVESHYSLPCRYSMRNIDNRK